jgi:hypothetical protein
MLFSKSNQPSRQSRAWGLSISRGLNGTFFQRFRLYLQQKYPYGYVLGKLSGRSETGWERKKGHEKQAFIDFAWRDCPC